MSGTHGLVRSVILALACFAMLGPPPAAASHMLAGTEENPEFLDPPGDVQYSSLYTGTKDHEYLDLAAAWFSYDNATDNISLTVRVASTERFSATINDWDLRCALQVNLTQGAEKMGKLEFWWAKPVRRAELRQGVDFYERFDPVHGAPVKHGFQLTTAKPGYLRFDIERNALLAHGSAADTPTALCLETYSPAQSATVTQFTNSDEGASKGAYSFAELRPISNAAGKPEPWEQEASPSQTPASPSETGASSSIPWWAVVVVAAVALMAYRRNR